MKNDSGLAGSTKNDRARPSPVPTAEVQKAAEIIADHFRKDIATGKLKAGDALASEGELISHFGVSRPTLRSAFRILESESLLSISRGAQGGPRICHPGVEVVSRNFGLLLQLRGTRVADLFYVRQIIEPAAAAHLAELRPPAGLEALEANLAEQADALSDPADFERFAHTAMSFYGVICEHCGNDILALFGRVLHELFPKTVDFTLRSVKDRDPERLKEVFAAVSADHRQLLRLIKRGERDKARRFWEGHLDRENQHAAELLPKLGTLPFTAFE